MPDGHETEFPATFSSADGLTLASRAHLPIGAVRAKAIVIHGLGDHGEGLPYRNLREALVARNVAVYSFDLRGHGASAGARMYTPSWQHLIDDVHAFVELVRQTSAPAPAFLIGISLGGLIALDFAQRHPKGLAGIILAAPATDSSGVSPIIKSIMRALSRIAPRARLDPRLDTSRISRDSTSASAYLSDPNFQVKTTPRLAVEVLDAMKRTLADSSSLMLPALVLHGEADTIVPAAGSASLFQSLGSADKSRITYPGAYHNLFIETNRQDVFKDIGDWITQRAVGT